MLSGSLLLFLLILADVFTGVFTDVFFPDVAVGVFTDLFNDAYFPHEIYKT